MLPIRSNVGFRTAGVQTNVGFRGPPGQLDPEDRAKLEAALAAADATISSTPDNILQSLADGLYVPPPQLASENW